MTDPHAKLTALIQMVKSDGLLAQSEVDMLMNIAQRSGFSEEQLTEAATQKPKGLNKLQLSDKIRLFYQALLIANADGEISDEETIVLHDLGLALRLDAFKVQILIQNVKEIGSTELSEEDLDNLLQL